MTKPYEEWSFEEKVNYHTGRIILAIGEGKFREAVYSALLSVTTDGFNRGVESTKKPKKVKK
jgi:hypothetical protein